MTERRSADDPAARAEYLALMAQHELRPGHTTHVGALAVRLYDQLSSLHQLSGRARLWLEAAAHLHDIGHGAGPQTDAHHKESARLIREHPWRTFAPDEVEIIAQVARYHRRAVPELAHDEFRRLAPAERRVVQVLAACLRLADALDRSHERRVSDVRVEIAPARLTLHLQSKRPLVRERTAAEKRSDLARAIFEREILLVPAEATPTSASAPAA